MRFALLAIALPLAACAPSAVGSPAPPAVLSAAADTPEARGQAFVDENCATCHATGRSGDSPYPPAPPFRTLASKYDVDGLAEAFAEGIEVGHRGQREMPTFELDPAEIDDLIAYLEAVGA
ncbi:MAG: c-type cytochrome [Alphaproteobacteria bacterium]|nr:c-type cytochrome [Alphaproteobacteria bacterium]